MSWQLVIIRQMLLLEVAERHAERSRVWRWRQGFGQLVQKTDYRVGEVREGVDPAMGHLILEH